jgi:hypothetical protein
MIKLTLITLSDSTVIQLLNLLKVYRVWIRSFVDHLVVISNNKNQMITLTDVNFSVDCDQTTFFITCEKI